MSSNLVIFTAVIVLGGLAAPRAAAAQEPEPGASNNTELGWVVASGNASATTVGLRNVYGYRWPGAVLTWESGWVRAASRDGDRFAVDTGSGIEIREPGRAIDSQRLFSKLRYERRIASRHDWFSNLDAVRDEPSNINRQVVVAAGLGTRWRTSDQLTFRTSYGIAFTDEDLVIEGSRRFTGYRLFYGLKAQPRPVLGVESELTADGSFEEAGDVRADWLNAVSVAINSRMALKSSVRLLFRNEPALESLVLRSPQGVPIGTIDVVKEKFDTNVTTSLVISF